MSWREFYETHGAPAIREAPIGGGLWFVSSWMGGPLDPNDHTAGGGPVARVHSLELEESRAADLIGEHLASRMTDSALCLQLPERLDGSWLCAGVLSNDSPLVEYGAQGP